MPCNTSTAGELAHRTMVFTAFIFTWLFPPTHKGLQIKKKKTVSCKGGGGKEGNANVKSLHTGIK